MKQTNICCLSGDIIKNNNEMGLVLILFKQSSSIFYSILVLSFIGLMEPVDNARFYRTIRTSHIALTLYTMCLNRSLNMDEMSSASAAPVFFQIADPSSVGRVRPPLHGHSWRVSCG